MSTNCSVIQLLQPDPPRNFEITDEGNSLAVEESGVLALVIGVNEYAVLFTQAKLSPSYEFLEEDISSTDTDPLSITPSMPTSGRTVDGFLLQLDANPDTVNYRFRWRVKVTAL